MTRNSGRAIGHGLHIRPDAENDRQIPTGKIIRPGGPDVDVANVAALRA